MRVSVYNICHDKTVKSFPLHPRAIRERSGREMGGRYPGYSSNTFAVIGLVYSWMDSKSSVTRHWGKSFDEPLTSVGGVGYSTTVVPSPGSADCCCCRFQVHVIRVIHPREFNGGANILHETKRKYRGTRDDI